MPSADGNRMTRKTAKGPEAAEAEMERLRADARRYYHLALGRGWESEHMVELHALEGREAMLRNFLSSGEFVDNTVTPLSRGLDPWRARPTPPGELAEWAAESMPLTAGGAEAAKAAGQSWAALFAAVAADPVARAILGEGAALLTPPVLATLNALARAEGRVEAVDGAGARGWVVDPTQPDRPVRLELWINGAFVAAGTPDRLRPDIRDRFGGEGKVGFDLAAPPGFDDGRPETVLEVRLAASGLVLGGGRFTPLQAAVDALAEARRELDQARRLLRTIEARLPAIDKAAALPLSHYDLWRTTWRGVRGGDAEASAEAADVHVVIDGRGAPAAWIEDTASSVAARSNLDGMTLAVDVAHAGFARDLAARIARRGVAAEAVTPPADASLDVVCATEAAEAVLFIEAGRVLEPGALAALGRALASGAEAAYADEDVFAAADDDLDDPVDPALRRRACPELKPAFDPDMLRQTPYPGRAVAFRAQVLARVGLRAEAGVLFACDALLRLEPAAVAHVPRVLSTRRPDVASASEALWPDCVRADAAARGEAVEVEPHADLLGATVPGAARVRRIPAQGATATVIVPTRDSLDLLRPCIDSLLAHRHANRTVMDILIVDHESAEPATRVYLDGLVADGAARVLPYAGVFNWALMNNLAAAESAADVLVFLNNDTVVLSPDWLDELVAQASRPEVGAVGCRLLYGDGTVQHAGLVARDIATHFVVHEGVGLRGSDPGYLGRNAVLRSATAVTGACMAVARETFHELGGFDAAELPVEGNDVDLCLRARSRGLTTLWTPWATLYHLESRTRGYNVDAERKRAAAAAMRLIWRRWGEAFGRDPRYNAQFDRLSPAFTRLRPPPPDDIVR